MKTVTFDETKYQLVPKDASADMCADAVRHALTVTIGNEYPWPQYMYDLYKIMLSASPEVRSDAPTMNVDAPWSRLIALAEAYNSSVKSMNYTDPNYRGAYESNAACIRACQEALQSLFAGHGLDSKITQNKETE